MVPLEDGITPIVPVSVDRRASPGAAAPGAERQNDAPAKPAVAAKGGQSGSSAADAIGMQLQTQDARITFEKDAASGKMVMRLKDSSGKVIRQIPPDEMLRLARAIDQYLGLLVDRHS